MEKFSITRRVYYYETDKMGRVYHSNFVNWMEEARTEFIRKSGISYKEMEDLGIFLPVSEIKIKYFAPVEYDENLVITLEVVEISRVKVSFSYEFSNFSGTIKYAESFSTNIFSDINGKIKRVEKDLIDKIFNSSYSENRQGTEK